MLANYHTHTVRCHHAVGTERQYIQKAIESGFKILGFSDHVPQPYPAGFISGIRMGMEELEDYTKTLISLREEFKDKIQILIGYEVEYSEKYFEPLMKELKKYPLDYIIQGQHFVPDEIEGFYAGVETDSELRLKDYVNLTSEGMKTGLFAYLAHPDLINFTGNRNVYLREMEKLIGTAIDLKIPLEVNMLGFIEKRNYPCDDFFTLASQMNAEFVIGCDAHKPQGINQIEDVSGLKEFLERNKIKIIEENILKDLGEKK